MHLTFTVISTPTTNECLVQEVLEILKNAGAVSRQQCPPVFSEWYQCPAVRLSSGRMIFGIDEIRTYAERELVKDART